MEENEDAKGIYWKCWNAWSTNHLPTSSWQHLPGALSSSWSVSCRLFYFDSEWFQVCFTSLESPEGLLWFISCNFLATRFIDFHWYALMIVDARPPNSSRLHQVASKSWSTLHQQRSPWHLPFLREAVWQRMQAWDSSALQLWNGRPSTLVFVLTRLAGLAGPKEMATCMYINHWPGTMLRIFPQSISKSFSNQQAATSMLIRVSSNYRTLWPDMHDMTRSSIKLLSFTLEQFSKSR